MKKILVLLIILFSVSCLHETKQSTILEKSFVQGVGYIKYVEFDGHEYVKFYNGNHGSVCHSPNCPCLKQYKTVEN